MKTSKILLTLLSVATIGLSSTVVMADGEGDQLRERLRERINMEITPELQAAIDAFRAQREELMAQFRELRAAHREAMVDLWADLKTATESGDEEAILAAKQAIRDAHIEFRGANGAELREARETFKEARRVLRERIREQRPPVDGEG